MNQHDRVKLLFGPYHAPALRRGDHAFCFFRDANVVITSWTDARISWPRCRSVAHARGHPGLLVCEELARTVRNEAEIAIAHWWGVSTFTVGRWRKALGVGRSEPEGSRRLIQAAAQSGAEGMKEKEFTDDEREIRRQNALRLKLGKHLWLGYHGPRWTKKQLALLGNLPDRVVAERIGRSVNAVRIKRERLGIANPFHGRRRKPLA